MSTEIKRLLKFSLGSWITFAFSFIASPITTFLLAPEEFGKFASFILFQTLVIYLVTLGMDQVFLRFYHQTENKAQLLLKCFFVEIASFAVVLMVLLMFSDYLNYFITGVRVNNIPLAVEGCVLCLMLSLSNLGLSVIRMENKAARFSFIQISNSLVNYAAFFFILIFIEKSYTAFIYASLFSATFQIIFIYFFTLQIPLKDWNFLRQRWDISANLKFGLPFVPAFFVDYIFSNSDRFFLRFFGDFRSLGIYSLGLRLSSAFNVVQTGFHMYWAPFSYDRYQIDPTDKEFYPKVFDILNAGLLTLILLAHSFRELIMYVVAPEYHSVIDFFPFLLFAPYFYSLTEVTQVGINFSLKTKLFLWINLATLVANLTFGYLLITRFGQKGAALNIAITYFILFALKSFYGFKNYHLPLDWTRFCVSFCSVFLFLALDLFLKLDLEFRVILLVFNLVLISILYRRRVRYLWTLIMDAFGKSTNTAS